MINLPLRARVDLLSDMGGCAVDCRMMFLGDRIRLLTRTYQEIIRRFKMFPDPDHLFRSLQSSEEIKQFYEINRSDGITAVLLRDPIYSNQGPLEDVRIDVRFRLESVHCTVPLPLAKMKALGHLLPLLRSNLSVKEIQQSLEQHLNSEEFDWAFDLLSVLRQRGFTTDSPLPRNHFQDEKLESRLTFMGHSSLFLQTPKANVLTDPYLRLDDGIPVVSMNVPRTKLTAIICSHSHYDHCDLQSFLLFDKDTLLIVPKVKQPSAFNPPIIEPMKALGFRNFREVEPWEPVQIEDVELVPVPFHGEQDEPDTVIDHFTYVLRTNDLCVYAGVDSYRDTFGDMIPVLDKVRETYHPVLAFLPVSKFMFRYDGGGANGFCRYFDSTLIHKTFQYTGSAEDAAEWVRVLQPKWVSPYAMFSFAPWSTPIHVMQFERALKRVNLEKKLYPIRPFQHLDASAFLKDRELHRRALVRWFHLGSVVRKIDKDMQQNRIYRYFRYRGRQARAAAEHH
jgi:L-ascorbate metabolism protein UlaG (beta-lactamase superfamily)